VLDALQKKDILPLEVEVTHQQQLLQHKSPAVKAVAALVLASTVNADRQKVFTTYLPALTTKGESAKGKILFEKNCAACHHLGGVGQKVGPDLGALTGKSGEQLLRAILDPNQAVEARYLNYTAVTKNGMTFTGLLASETATSITLAGADGKQKVILRSDLDELFSAGKSVMPEGLEKDITPPQMADLLAFLQANLPALKAKSFPGNNPEVIQPAKDGSLLLSASKAEIFGPSLILETKYGNLGFWSDPEDHAAWTVSVTKGGKYAVWLDWAMTPNAAGNTFILEVGTGQLIGKVASTGSWDTYKQGKVGMITLPAGQVRIMLRPQGKIHGALIDLKSIKLVPVP
jgi:putative heme-binding domain-containing protein